MASKGHPAVGPTGYFASDHGGDEASRVVIQRNPHIKHVFCNIIGIGLNV